MKKKTALLLMLCGLMFPVNAMAIDIKVNEALLELDTPPVLKDSRIYVPFRDIAQSIGAEVEWEPKTKTVTAVRSGLTVSFRIGDTSIKAGGKAVNAEAPVILENSRTLVPLRAFTEMFGATVDWDDKTKTASINIDRPESLATGSAYREVSLKVEDNGVTATSVYPSFTGNDAVTNTILTDAKKHLDAAVAELAASKEEGATAIYSSDYEVKYSDNRLISLLATHMMGFSGAAHPTSFFTCLNIDTVTGKVLSANELMGEGYDVKEKAVNAFTKIIDSEPDYGFFEDAKEELANIEDFTFFVNKEGKIEFVLDDTVIAPHAAGAVFAPTEDKVKYKG